MASDEFTLEKSKYDQNTYHGRWYQFMDMVDPSLLFCTNGKLNESKALLENFENESLEKTVDDAQLWQARRIRDSMVHPQTGDTVPVIFRLASFVPVNIPIVAGMLLMRPTLPTTIFWQWANQSYNAGFNYANRNASSEDELSSIFMAYASATLVSCGTAVGLGKAVERASNLNPALRSLIQRTVPFIAVAAAGSFNAVFMHQNELKEGIDIVDNTGKVHGRSQLAAKKSLTEVALTRIAIPMPVLLLPPYLMEGMTKLKLMPTNRIGKMLTELSVITLCLWFAVPSSIALFPQTGSISVSFVEKEFQQCLDANDERVEEFFYNKGI